MGHPRAYAMSLLRLAIGTPYFAARRRANSCPIFLLESRMLTPVNFWNSEGVT